MSLVDSYSAALGALLAALDAPLQLTVPQWAETRRVLPSSNRRGDPRCANYFAAAGYEPD
jgi:hypothetical protein